MSPLICVRRRLGFNLFGLRSNLQIISESVHHHHLPLPPPLPPCHAVALLLQLVVFTTLTVAVTTCGSDPVNLVFNGGFENEPFSLSLLKPTQDIGFFFQIGAYIPAWRVTKNSVQVVSSQAFDPAIANTSYCVHLNTKGGAGAIQSSDLYTTRKQARYYLSLHFTGQPDGGPLYKAMQVTISEKGIISYTVRHRMFVAQSNPYPSRTPLLWMARQWAFLGTGKSMRLELESTTPGPVGILVDDIQVILDNMLDNGSFEVLTIDFESLTSSILQSPSTALKNWVVNSGSVKLLRGSRFQSSDNSSSVLDMNGNTGGSIITYFGTTPKSTYAILLDIATNPDIAETDKQGIPEQCSTKLEVTVKVQATGKTLLTDLVTSKRKKGLQSNVVKWETVELRFDAETYTNVTIQFASKVGGKLGPLLDNIAIFQQLTTLVSEPNNTAMSSFHRRPLWCTHAWIGVLLVLNL
ncbi:unnamed protein product [Sphagnum troendelagicum]|uniref:DUF642 domain-containing protein n=1 Tax=Sphagnum troendelagicum TaxID=128251 RepID=A0ABP0U688_9BRYO